MVHLVVHFVVWVNQAYAMAAIGMMCVESHYLTFFRLVANELTAEELTANEQYDIGTDNTSVSGLTVVSGLSDVASSASNNVLDGEDDVPVDGDAPSGGCCDIVEEVPRVLQLAYFTGFWMFGGIPAVEMDHMFTGNRELVAGFARAGNVYLAEWMKVYPDLYVVVDGNFPARLTVGGEVCSVDYCRWAGW